MLKIHQMKLRWLLTTLTVDDEIAPSLRTASGTDGSLVSNSNDSEDFDIRTKLNSICKDFELLKSNFERLKRSTDLPANSSQVEALENENMALKNPAQGRRSRARLAQTSANMSS